MSITAGFHHSVTFEARRVYVQLAEPSSRVLKFGNDQWYRAV